LTRGNSFFPSKKKRRFKIVPRETEAGSKIEKKVAKVVDIVKRRLFSSWGPGSFFASSFHRLTPFPLPAATLDDSYHERSNLPHAVGSSRFGGHCTSSGGRRGVVVGGKSIFHDDVACRRSSPFLPRPPSNPLPSLRFRPRGTWLRYELYSPTRPKGASSSRCRSIDTSQASLCPRRPSTLKSHLAVHTRALLTSIQRYLDYIWRKTSPLISR